MIGSFFSLLLWAGLFTVSDTLPVHSILNEKQVITINDSYGYIHKRELDLTILSKEGLDHAYISLFYDKLVKVTDFQLAVTDPVSGKTIEKASLRDMSDAAIYSNTSIFDDNRRKYYQIKSGNYPVQVKITTETKSESNFFLPRWIPVHHYFQKVNESSLEVNYPERLGIRFKELNLSGNRKKEKLEDGNIRLTWAEKALPVQGPDLEKDEDHRLLLAPVNFALGEYIGKMGDWSGLASWQYELNEGRDKLPIEFRKQILSLVEGIEDRYEKVSVLYDFLQKNFRYVSIQLGVGGWQTMKASDVVKYAYGDCKGLTNLMKAMLMSVGIPSNYTLVYAGADADDIETDLPSNQFNHVILQVPTEGSPIWLECTSNSLPAGFLGDFTKDRHVLVTTAEGGYLTKTPSYKSDIWNSIETEHKLIVNEQGNADIFTKIHYSGNFAENILMLDQALDTREKKDYFTRNSPVSGLIIGDFQLEIDKKDSLPSAIINYQGLVQRFTQKTAKRVILRKFMGEVKQGILSGGTLYQKDHYEISLPENLILETRLENQKLEEPGVTVLFDVKEEGKNIFITREIQLDIPEDLPESEKNELFKRINYIGNQAVNFVKPNLTSIHE